MLPNVKTFAITAVTALSLALATATPSHALGKNERKFLQGVAAAVVVGAIVNDVKKKNRRQAQTYYAPQQQYYVAPKPQYYAPQKRYVAPTRSYYQEPTRRVYRQAPTYYQSSVYNTPAAVAFNAYGRSERLAIQRNLAAQGLYRSGIDGSFGPGTYAAIEAYARAIGASRQLSSRDGAFGVYDALIY